MSDNLEKWVEIETGVEIRAIKNEKGEWSCDGKEWYDTMTLAYIQAKKAGTLIFKNTAGDDSFTAWVLSLLHELQDLDPGSALKITRLGNEFTVTREQSVLPPLRVSELRELDLRLEDTNEQGKS